MSSMKMRGFTLVELIVVMGIVAFLTGIVLVAVNPGRQFAQARNTQRESDVRTLVNSINQHSTDNGGAVSGLIPSSPTNICNDDGGGCASGTIDLRPLLVPTYLSDIPVDPLGGTNRDTKYSVYRDAKGRVGVKALNAELSQTITYGAEGPIGPSDVAGLQLWLKADAGTNQSIGGAAALADGDPVGEWVDQSTTAHNATQAVSTKRPTLKLSIQNGKPVLRTDGIDDYLATTLSLPNEPFTAFLVVKPVNSNGAGTMLAADQSLSWQRLSLGTGEGANDRIWKGDGTNADFVGTTATVTNFQLLEFSVASGGVVTISRNGTAEAGGSGTAIKTSSWTVDVSSSNYRPFQGDIGEIILYNRVLTSTELSNVRSYLNSRWALY